MSFNARIDIDPNTCTLIAREITDKIDEILYTDGVNPIITFSNRNALVIPTSDFKTYLLQLKVFEATIINNFNPDQNVYFITDMVVTRNNTGSNIELKCTHNGHKIFNFVVDTIAMNVNILNRSASPDNTMLFSEWLYLLSVLQYYQNSF